MNNTRYMLLLICILLSSMTFTQTYEWKTLATGAGGWITGLDIHPSGNPIYVRSDVGSAYRYNQEASAWENIVTSENLPASDIYWNRYAGVLSIVSAPSNANKAYLAYFDGIYVSDNQGQDWERTNFPTTDMPPNDDGSKLSGERLAVDPINEDVVYFASVNNGLWRSEDGGNSWIQLTSLPVGLQGRGVRQVIFDSAAGSSNGRTNHIWVTIDGEDIYRSTDAGSNWAGLNLSGSFPGPIFLDAEVDAEGHLYCVGRDENFQTFGILRFEDDSWTSVQNNGTIYLNVAIDPFNLNRVVALSEGFTETAISTNALSTTPTWAYPTQQRSASNIPWLGWFAGDWFTIGEMVFDPSQPDKIWLADGVGVWNINDINTTQVIWEENSVNQEHLVSNDLVVNGDGKVVTAHWDRPLFLHQDLDVYPEIHQPTGRFNSSWDMDVSVSNPNFLAAIIEDHRFCCYDVEHRNSGYSLDGGVTWNRFSTMPDPSNTQGIYGNMAIAANDIMNIVWLPTGNEAPYYTTDMGETWNQAVLPNDQGNCCLNFNFVYKKALVSDKVADNTFYIYNWENGSIFISEDGGANWQERTALQDYYGWNAKLTAAPGFSQHLWYSHGAEQEISFMQPLKRSTDGGLSWSTMENTSEVLNHAIGKALPGASYPTLFIQGRVDGVLGYWMSADEGTTWTNLGTYPNGIYDVAKVLEADPFIPSRLYIGFGGNGFVYGQDDNLVNTSTASPGEAADIRLYPNPTTGQITLTNPLLERRTIDIFTSHGALVSSHLSIDAVWRTNLEAGVYFIVIRQASGEVVEKVVVLE